MLSGSEASDETISENGESGYFAAAQHDYS
jgi:hypothetical protein